MANNSLRDIGQTAGGVFFLVVILQVVDSFVADQTFNDSTLADIVDVMPELLAVGGLLYLVYNLM